MARRSKFTARAFCGTFVNLLFFHCSNAIGAEVSSSPEKVSAVPAALRESERLSSFYEKYANAEGIPVVASRRVSDAAVIEAAFIVAAMLKTRGDVRKAIADNHVRVVVMAPTENTTDVPEHSDLTPKDYWDTRARGLGATPARPVTSCAEENILNLRGDRYARENILIHEFAHTIHTLGLNTADSTFESKLRSAYQHAMQAGLWENTYAATNYAEYWAEAVQSYFDSNDANNAEHNGIDTREELRRYDPEIFSLIDDVFRAHDWRYKRYDVRQGRTSPRMNQSIRLSIINESRRPVSIYWLSANEQKLYRKLAAGESYVQSTYVGHKWRAVFDGDKPAAELTATEDGKWNLR
jgi:hypothetical protein